MIRIEDDFEDILGKAMNGQGLQVDDLARRAGIETARVKALLEGNIHDAALRAAAEVLNLDPSKLIDRAHERWAPDTPLPEGVSLFNTPFPVPGYEEMTVNSYLVVNGKAAAAFDTGANCDALLREIAHNDLQLEAVFITHAHRDHIAALGAIREAHPGTTILYPKGEPVPGDEILDHGATRTLGDLKIEARETSGHSPGALSYRVEGLDCPVVFSGDALFCLSIGKVPASKYQAALEQNRNELLSLPDATVLCPGHGPISTIGQEKQKNPFF